ncbi:MAG: BamA/TamA family outer membrane protein, partial [Rhodospirillales bacterium]
DVRFLQRFFAGGDDLRGFATSGIGPRDKLTGDALGGEWKYTGRVQLAFPFAFLPEGSGVKGRLFSDVGSAGKLEPSNSNVGDTASVRLSVGTGLTWLSPFGPIGVDLGFPLLKEAFDEKENFRISFGTQF